MTPPDGTQHGHIAEANGISIYYESHGHGDPLLLLHAGSLTGDMWQPYLAGFAERYRVITPDMPGHGRSGNPTGAMSYRQLADDTVAFIQALDLREPLIAGFSDGGQVALEIGMRHPTLPKSIAMGGVYFRVTATPNARSCGTRSVTRRHLTWIWRTWFATIPAGPRGSTKSMDRTAGSRSWFDSKPCGQRR